MGSSPVHAETVALVQNLTTGYLSPQFHVVFDDKFETVYADEDEEPPEWEHLCIFESFHTAFDEGTTPPSLADEWLTPEEIEQQQLHRPVTELCQGRKLYEDLHSKEVKADFEFQPPPPPKEFVPPTPHKPPDKQLHPPTRELGSWTRSPPQQQPPLAPIPESVPQPQQQVQAQPTACRNPSYPTRAAQSTGIQCLDPSFHGKSYDKPRPTHPSRYVSAFAAALSLSNPMTRRKDAIWP